MAESSLVLYADHEEDLAAALENALSPCAASIAIYRQLEQKYNAIPPRSSSYDDQLSKLRTDFVASQRDSAHHLPRVNAIKIEVEQIEATLAEAKAKLEEEQNQLALSNARASEIENQLNGLEQERTQQQELKRQMLLKKQELKGLLVIAKQFRDQFATSEPMVTVEPTSPHPSAPLLDILAPASETLQDSMENMESSAAGLDNKDNACIATYQGHEYVYPDGDGKDDPDYVDSDVDTDAGGSVENAFESPKVLSKLPGECIRCMKHGYDCIKQKKGDTACVRCQDEDAACSLKKQRRGGHRGRQPDEKLNSHLRFLLEERGYDFPTIVKMNIFKNKTEVALRQRWRRLKKRESEGIAPPETERQDIWNLEPTPPFH